MPNNWKTYKLGEVCTKITDGAHQSPKSVTLGGLPMASVKDMTPYGINIDSCRRISGKDFESLVKQGCQPTTNDVLIAKDGNSALDTVCVIKEPIQTVLLSSVAILKPNLEKINPYFLKYYFQMPSILNYLKSSFISGAAIPRVILKDFKLAQIDLPPLPEQQAIASILSSLDDKIELNLQMNKTLEEMAMTLYKHWFVDFGPFKDGEFVDSELGLIPEGWEVKTLSSLAHFKNGKGLKPEYKIDNAKYDVFGSNGVIGKTDQIMFADPVIAIGRVGANYGEVHYSTKPCWISDNAVTVQPLNQEYFWWLLQSLRLVDYTQFVAGSAQPLITQGAIKEIKCAVPNEKELIKFSNELELLFGQLQINISENQTLTALRDTLLPKLISGEVRVKEAEQSLASIM